MPRSESLPDPIVRALAAALELEPAARLAAVETLCARSPALADAIRAEAAAMLDATRGAAPASPGNPSDHIGGFQILAQIGAGGMGVVYLAEQKAPVRRRVALKVIKLGMDTSAVLARFDLERQALALMDHTNIAKVYEAGATPDGRPYFAMEHVRGIPITRYCDDNRLGIDERLVLFRQVCSGVQHAHQKGVIHRDLTPNNVLVTVQDGQPVAKIIDFGLARATDHRLTEKTVFTEQGMILGTPEYMSPEQAGLSALDIDMRSDVYTLGVLLYELLTGSTPFPREELRRAGYDQMCAIIRSHDPERPSTKITKSQRDTAEVAKRRRTDPQRLLRRLRGDLDWVVIKCLEKDRTRRYDTVSELAADVQRHLDHEPVLAHAPSFRYRITKLARRHRGQLLAASAVLVALVVGLTLAIYFWLDAAAQAERADREAHAAKEQESLANERAQDAQQARAREAERAQEAVAHAARARHNEDRAVARQREFDQLAGIVHLRHALAAAAELYPAWPDKAAHLQRWLDEDAARLERIAPEIEATIQALRAQALPATAAEAERDQTTHPRYAEWQALIARCEYLHRAQAIRNGQELALPALTAAESAMGAKQLADLALPRVDFNAAQRIWGEEARGLTLAQAAWAKAAELPAPLRADIADTLAWALFANGQDAAAIAMSEEALTLAPEGERSAYAGYLARIREGVAAMAGEHGEAVLARHAQELAAVAADVGARRTYRFTAESLAFLHDALCELRHELQTAFPAARADVAARLDWALRIGDLTRAHPNARVTWSEARAAIARADGVVASELYRGQGIELREADMVGLVPIGMNPVTKLWEFYELRSAWDGSSDPATLSIPQHASEGSDPGHIAVAVDTGIVFVLLPGGTFMMGMQNSDPNGPNFEPLARGQQTPHAVTVAPFLLARHELTQAQWQRMTGDEPSMYRAGDAPGHRLATHPVEQLTWTDCDLWLGRLGMAMPTEAQWEYACRAGTSTPWWTGGQRDTLQGAANLADRTAKARGMTWDALADWPDFDDGFVLHAPVDTLAANAFGLHHVHGNVSEWCADAYGIYGLPVRDGDGLRLVPKAGNVFRMLRGGSYCTAAWEASAGARFRANPTTPGVAIGVRPARASRPRGA